MGYTEQPWVGTMEGDTVSGKRAADAVCVKQTIMRQRTLTTRCLHIS